MRKVLATKNAPGAIGPYSQAIIAGNMIYTSGQLGMNTEGVFPETIEEQTRLSLENVKAILEAAGTDLAHVVKTTVFMADMNDFAAMNGVYAQYFTGEAPARSAVEVARLPKDGKVEIEVVALID